MPVSLRGSAQLVEKLAGGEPGNRPVRIELSRALVISERRFGRGGLTGAGAVIICAGVGRVFVNHGGEIALSLRPAPGADIGQPALIARIHIITVEAQRSLIFRERAARIAAAQQQIAPRNPDRRALRGRARRRIQLAKRAAPVPQRAQRIGPAQEKLRPCQPGRRRRIKRRQRLISLAGAEQRIAEIKVNREDLNSFSRLLLSARRQ